jgi:hypothetical protein
MLGQFYSSPQKNNKIIMFQNLSEQIEASNGNSREILEFDQHKSKPFTRDLVQF